MSIPASYDKYPIIIYIDKYETVRINVKNQASRE